MRLALLIFALVASPALARDLPPDQPSYDKPTFERPDTPPPPPPPPPPEKPDEPKEPREPLPPKPVKVSHPGLKCYTDDDGHRRVSFTKNVQPDMYYLGRKFCKKVPHDIPEVTVRCVDNGGTYQIQYSTQVPHKAQRKAKPFCVCVLGLD